MFRARSCIDPIRLSILDTSLQPLADGTSGAGSLANLNYVVVKIVWVQIRSHSAVAPMTCWCHAERHAAIGNPIT